MNAGAVYVTVTQSDCQTGQAFFQCVTVLIIYYKLSYLFIICYNLTRENRRSRLLDRSSLKSNTMLIQGTRYRLKGIGTQLLWRK